MKVNPPELDKGLFNRVIWQRFKFAHAARKNKCDLLFAPGGSYASSFYPAVTMSRNMLPFEWKEIKRYGLSLMTIKSILLRFIQKRSFYKVQGVIFLTEYAQNIVNKDSRQLSAKELIIPHGLNPRFSMKPRPQHPISKYSINDPYRILYVSIVDQYKHQWHVATAVSLLRKSGYPIILDMVGPFKKNAIRRLNKKLTELDPNSNYIHYHGSIPFLKLHNYYANANLGLFASSCENLPNILLEKMGAGLPIACSNLGPMPEILKDAGVYFNPEDPKEIAEALRIMIDSPKLRSQLAAESFNKSKEYSWEVCAKKTFGFLVEIALSNKPKTFNC